MTKTIRADERGGLAEDALLELGAALKACRVCAFPTDTVYGLGTNGLVKAAVRKLYEIKGRDAMKPLPILLESAQQAPRWVEWTPQAERLAARFWPGPLTLALKPTREGRLLTFLEFPTLAVRVPAHPAALALLRAAGVPLASTSANFSGRPALNSAAEVLAELGGRVDYIVDSAPGAGAESTVVDATTEPVRVLREGALSRAEILGALAEAKTA